MPCFAAFGDQTAAQLRERFQQALTHSLVAEHVDRLIDTSLGSNWTRLYDSVGSSLCPAIFRSMLTRRFCATVVPILFPVHFILVLELYASRISCSFHLWPALFPCGLFDVGHAHTISSPFLPLSHVTYFLVCSTTLQSTSSSPSLRFLMCITYLSDALCNTYTPDTPYATPIHPHTLSLSSTNCK